MIVEAERASKVGNMRGVFPDVEQIAKVLLGKIQYSEPVVAREIVRRMSQPNYTPAYVRELQDSMTESYRNTLYAQLE